MQIALEPSHFNVLTSPSSHTNQVCHNSVHSYYCDCPKGYELNTISQCNDIDECSWYVGCQHYCENTIGSFHGGCEQALCTQTRIYLVNNEFVVIMRG